MLIAFVNVRVPAADVGKCDFQADAALNQLRDLAERIAEWRLRIVRAILRFELRWIDLLQIIDRFECFFSGSMQRIVYSLIVNRFEAALYCCRTLAGADAEVRQIRNRQRGCFALHRARHVLRH